MIIYRSLRRLLQMQKQCRYYARKMSYNRTSKFVPSKTIRQQFLDFFIKGNNHNFIRSSPVVPFYDPSVPFVNAGMNQFKGVFLGTQTPKFTKVANTQKCIRVGGKHNDLDVVGTDGYHHTFFEMMGNWSFGECSKQESCLMAWKLLTDVYKINKKNLYVTYFGGDDELELLPDLECQEIWKNIGLPPERILPFGLKDNFWEMGLTGPCGPCTEIHYDHGGLGNRAEFVNKGLHELVEIWNIVFIEYNRDASGNINPLPKKHVDTGMGFERLVAILQNKMCNYDTDIFSILFSAIQKNCTNVPKYKNYFGENDWNRLHTGYRILADHCRMITVSLADGMIPEQNPKLRKIMRRAFTICENTFKKKEGGFLKELSNYVIENLGPVYPELENNVELVHQIINYEEEVFQSLRINANNEWSKIITNAPNLKSLDVIEMPGLVHAYKDISTANVKVVTPQLGFKLFDSYGLDEECIGKLCKAMNILFDEQQFKTELDNVKLRSKQANFFNTNNAMNLKNIDVKTDDSFKYHYSKFNHKYIFSDLDVQVLNILNGKEFVQTIPPNVECSLILDKTNLYSEAGGQVSDIGFIEFNTGIFEIYNIQNIDKYVLHKGVYKSKLNLNINEKGIAKFNEDYRLANMRNHTATHLLNACIKDLKGATCQKSSKVTDKYLNLDVAIFSSKLTIDDIADIESKIKQIISDGVHVNHYEVDCRGLMDMNNVTLIPGEIYPDTNIRIIEIKSNGNTLSREPCCGTHVFNCKDIENFCIISFKSLGRSTVSIHAVTGDRANLAMKNSQELLDDITNLQRNVYDNIDKPEVLEIAVSTLKQRFAFAIDDENILSVVKKNESIEKLNNITKQIKDTVRNTLREFIDMEMQSVLHTGMLKSNTDQDFIVHYLRTSMILENVPLQKATQVCPNIPVLIISYSNNIVKARCCVPQNLITDKFDAEKWLKIIGNIFKSPIAPPKGQDPTNVCIMKGKKLSISDWHILLTDSLDSAKYFAKKNL